MSYISPLANSFAQTSQVARTQSDTRTRESGGLAVLRRSARSSQATAEREVESTDAVFLQTQEEDRHNENGKKRKRHHEDSPTVDPTGPDGLDLTA